MWLSCISFISNVYTRNEWKNIQFINTKDSFLFNDEPCEAHVEKKKCKKSGRDIVLAISFGMLMHRARLVCFLQMKSRHLTEVGNGFESDNNNIKFIK